MSCENDANCTCGCCAGISVQTPQGEMNLPGQSAISVTTRFDDALTRQPLGLSIVILKPEQFRVVIEFHRE